MASSPVWGEQMLSFHGEDRFSHLRDHQKAIWAHFIAVNLILYPSKNTILLIRKNHQGSICRPVALGVGQVRGFLRGPSWACGEGGKPSSRACSGTSEGDSMTPPRNPAALPELQPQPRGCCSLRGIRVGWVWILPFRMTHSPESDP